MGVSIISFNFHLILGDMQNQIDLLTAIFQMGGSQVGFSPPNSYEQFRQLNFELFLSIINRPKSMMRPLRFGDVYLI